MALSIRKLGPKLIQAYYIGEERALGRLNSAVAVSTESSLRQVRLDLWDPYARPDPGELFDLIGGRPFLRLTPTSSLNKILACAGTTIQGAIEPPSCDDVEDPLPDNVVSIVEARTKINKDPPSEPHALANAVVLAYPTLEAVNRTVEADEKSHLISLMAYAVRVFGFDALLAKFQDRHKQKHGSFDVIIAGLFHGIASGRKSLQELAGSVIHPMTKKPVTRKRIEAVLNNREFADKVYEIATSVVATMKRGNMLEYEGVYGGTVACVDGVETHRQHYDIDEFESAVSRDMVCPLCNVAVKRNGKTNEIIGYDTYHRLVLISALSTRGTIPLVWEFQTSDFGKRYQSWLKRKAKVMTRMAKQSSSVQTRMVALLDKRKPDTAERSIERAKQEGELTILTALLKRLGPERLPFDYIVGDGLYSKAGVGELVEKGGACLVAVLKEEKRIVRENAREDFFMRPADRTWIDLKNRDCQGWIGEYEDKNRTGENKLIRVVRVVRRDQTGQEFDNYFYCSNNAALSPISVERLRAGRWGIEDSFNCWTNRWGFLKHIFHHTERACRSVLSLYLLVSSMVHNYRFGNLKRGKKTKAPATWKAFFELIIIGVYRLIGLTELVKYAVDYGQAWRSHHDKRITHRKSARIATQLVGGDGISWRARDPPKTLLS